MSSGKNDKVFRESQFLKDWTDRTYREKLKWHGNGSQNRNTGTHELPPVPSSHSGKKLAQIRQFGFKPAGKNREPAPCLWVEVFVVQMKRWRVTLALPLVAAPKLEKAFHPQTELRRCFIRKLSPQQFKNLHGRILVPDSSA